MGILKVLIKILSYICYVIIGVYALICLPMLAGNKPVVVLSGSMRPTFEVGTIIYYKVAAQNEIAEGDIITYQLGDELVTHRVKRILNSEYITQGDANNIEDGKAVPYQDIRGKVGKLTIPFLGYGIQFINSNMWIFIFIVAVLLLEFLLSNIKYDTITLSKKGHEQDEGDSSLAS